VQTQAVEDYLKAIYELQAGQKQVSTTALSERLAVAPASVTGMVKKLAALKLVDHQPYQGVTLTPAGEKIALEVVRHHRLVESYLSEALGVPWDQVHAEADKWEHVLSEDMEDRIDVASHPTTDPHGPFRPGTAVCLRASSGGWWMCRQARPPWWPRSATTTPHCCVTWVIWVCIAGRSQVVSAAPFEGPLTVRVGKAEHALGREVAGHILVSVSAALAPPESIASVWFCQPPVFDTVLQRS
jgi:DtxR family Mn-dependent transcriptional regulator